MNNETQNEKIFLTCFHHSDLTWQFPYAEYDAIREQQLNLVMEFFEKYPEYAFIIDQAYVLQNYLERNPDRKEAVERAVRRGEGALELTGGYSIPDLNLCSGESLVRNEMLGRAYYQKEFGCVPQAASLMDAFGMPFQVPQILAKLGYKYLIPGRSPNPQSDLDPDKPYVWKGMGDTEILVAPNGANIDKTSYITNVPVILNEEERFRKTLTDLQNMDGNVLAYYMTEIQMLDEAFFRYLEEVNAAPDAKRQVTFGRFVDYCKTLDPSILPVYEGEFNPVFTGCYTTRIHVKQRIRAAENAIYAAELAAALARKPARLEEAWRQLSLGQFHDAACGCHHDACNVDVDAKLDYVVRTARQEQDRVLERTADGVLTVLNPAARNGTALVETESGALPKDMPVQMDGDMACFCAELPASGLRSFAVDAQAKPVQAAEVDPNGYCGQTDFYAFDFSQPMPRIRSLRYDRQVFGQEGFGELIFRHESGTMWEEVLLEIPCGAECQEERVAKVEEGPVFIKVTTEGRVRPGRTPISGNAGDYWPGFGALSFAKEYIFPRHLPYFKLRVHLHFEGYNTKIALRIPVEVEPTRATALYDTPFAAVARRPYFEVPYRYAETAAPVDCAHAKGDYPALHWVDYTDDQIGLSVANNGTPGHQIGGKDIFVSLLRSGTACKDGTMYPQPGTYENGDHVYEFAFADHTADDIGCGIRLGEVLNRKPVCLRTAVAPADDGMPFVSFDAENVVVSAIYPQGDDVVVRAYEALGRETRCAMQIRPGTQCLASDFYGGQQQPQDAGNIAFTPYEIKTFVLKNKA